jgi:hypothetical protein
VDSGPQTAGLPRSNMRSIIPVRDLIVCLRMVRLIPLPRSFVGCGLLGRPENLPDRAVDLHHDHRRMENYAVGIVPT